MGKKRGVLVYKLLSSAGTGYFYVGQKPSRLAQNRLTLRKFDPIINQYVLFTEQKLKRPVRKRK